jgi:hypothetical protein
MHDAKELTKQKKDEKEPTEYDIYTDKRDMQLREKIAILLDKISNTNSPFSLNR